MLEDLSSKKRLEFSAVTIFIECGCVPQKLYYITIWQVLEKLCFIHYHEAVLLALFILDRAPVFERGVPTFPPNFIKLIISKAFRPQNLKDIY